MTRKLLSLWILLGLMVAGAQNPLFADDGTLPEGLKYYREHSKADIGVELLGAGLVYSVYGSYQLLEHLPVNIGFSYLKINANQPVSSFSVPISLSYLLGQTNHFLELLGGVNFNISSNRNYPNNQTVQNLVGQPVLPEVGIGWRYWPKLGGLTARVTGYLLIASSNLYVWPGADLGYSF